MVHGTRENVMEDDRFLRAPEVIRITGLSRPTIWRMEKRGQFPQRRSISANSVGWLSSEVENWMASRTKVEGYE
ncbi:MAG: DNA-binding protein [Deltaproteobacteria bacterium]|nr:MAG: DNA-binding protein [Deltaproteobacteria bacterium]